jgi:Asp-tRNA(Asn)/Glu-tRNA(Gln) amidotransferase A subunit family amidase
MPETRPPDASETLPDSGPDPRAFVLSGDRRRFFVWCARLSASGAALAGASAVLAQTPPETPKVPDASIEAAATLEGLDFTPAERELMNSDVADHLENYRKLRAIPLENNVAPALVLDPVAPGVRNTASAATREPAGHISDVHVIGDEAPPAPRLTKPSDPADLAFQPVTVLSELIRTRQVTSMELTELYLSRLRTYDPKLEAVITFTEDLARVQAGRADQEIKDGRYRGPLHGIPWAAKDLFDTRGIPTTWGAEPYRGRIPKEDATVVRKLEEAGAVLVAKTAVGALAWGDVWFGGTTKNPWKMDQGSSGSSAGSAATTAAGLVGFAIGTETLGSIVSPCTRCGCTGLRPTFGRVSRTGAMALSWSMDKIGALARGVEDCALILDAIRGADGLDPSAVDAPFDWRGAPDWRTLRVGYDQEAFESERDEKNFDDAALTALRTTLGLKLVPVKLPTDLPVGDMLIVLEAEAAAAFDELTRSNQDDQLKRQVASAWPNVFRAARLIPAVEYIQANRLRTILMRRFDEALADVDVYVTPTYSGITLRATNLTGHPSVVLPNGFRADGTPVSITFTGRLYGEAALLSLARAYQVETGWHSRRPNLG